MDEITTIVTTRHGETTFNVEKRYAGTMDVPLNATGRDDAIQASRNISRIMRFDYIICSRLQRARDTACYFSDHCTPIETALCNERNYGKMEGLVASEIPDVLPGVKYLSKGGDYHSLNPPGGETFEELYERAKSFLKYIFKNYTGSRLLIVSHGTFLQQFHAVMKNQTWEKALEYNIHNLECTLWRFRSVDLVFSKSICVVERKTNFW